MTVAAVQMVFFAVMPGLIDGPALLCALVFMLAAFGQIPDQRLHDQSHGAGRIPRPRLWRPLCRELHGAGGNVAADQVRL